MDTVSHCPNVSDYIRKASAKCAQVCGDYIQNGDCAYHCMRDSSKANLVEFCAKPRVLFGKKKLGQSNTFKTTLHSISVYLVLCRIMHCSHLFSFFYRSGWKISARSMMSLVEESKKIFIRCVTLPNIFKDIIILRTSSFVSRTKNSLGIILSIVFTWQQWEQNTKDIFVLRE